MPNSKPRILVLSSTSPTIGPAILGQQFYDAFRQEGYDADLMLTFPEDGHPEYLYVVEKSYVKSHWYRFKRKFRWCMVGGRPIKSGYHFFYTYEQMPPIPSQLVVDAIKKPYDLVLVVFWQGLLSFESISKIYDKLHCQIHFAGVDYSQMAGGCHFTGDCQRYMTGCGCCPCFRFGWKYDFTWWNVRYRKKVYDRVKPIVYGNRYVGKFYNQSFLLRNALLELGRSPIIDTDIFKSMPVEPLRKKYNIPSNKSCLLFFACQNLADSRKGVSYLLEAFKVLRALLTDEQASQVLIVMAGREFEKIEHNIPFDSRGLGYVKMNELPEIFSMSRCFICPSVNDAGPMMVNQSLCCSTPVVGFEMGAVYEVVKNKGTGIAVPLKDSIAFADGILQMIEMPDNEYEQMSQRCREVAMNTSSYKKQVEDIINIYHKYNDGKDN